MAVNNVTPLEISGNAVVTAVALGAIALKVLTANSERKGGVFFNNASVAVAYIGFTSGVSATLFTVRITGLSYFELPERYTGDVWAIRPTGGTADLLVTEYT